VLRSGLSSDDAWDENEGIYYEERRSLEDGEVAEGLREVDADENDS
jgi:hypothetical protein